MNSTLPTPSIYILQPNLFQIIPLLVLKATQVTSAYHIARASQ